MADLTEKMICGIVMPISAIDGCGETHWADVLEILTESVESVRFEANLVSNADEVGIIQKRIIQNLYDNPVVVCDVSGKNPNVMFELGIRLAFDKPTVIVKDDKTTFSFDTASIEHLEYPRDLRFTKIVEFKAKLAEKVKATHEKSIDDPNYTTFLKHFGEFKVAKLEKKEVSGQEYILEELRNIRTAMRRLDPSMSDYTLPRGLRNPRLRGDIDICMEDWPESQISDLLSKAHELTEIQKVTIDERGRGHKHLIIDVVSGANLEKIEAYLGTSVSRSKKYVKSLSIKANK